jgi:hypothetical protein
MGGGGEARPEDEERAAEVVAEEEPARAAPVGKHGVAMPIDDDLLEAALDRFLGTPKGQAVVLRFVEAEKLAQPEVVAPAEPVNAEEWLAKAFEKAKG